MLEICTMPPIAACTCPSFGMPRCNTESVLKCGAGKRIYAVAANWQYIELGAFS